jgi:hypothetical protein
MCKRTDTKTKSVCIRCVTQFIKMRRFLINRKLSSHTILNKINFNPYSFISHICDSHLSPPANKMQFHALKFILSGTTTVTLLSLLILLLSANV